MTIADSSQTRVAFIEESTYGTTPATPAFQTIRMTGEGLRHTRGTVRSNEIRPNRNAPGSKQVSGGAEGPINFEFSYGTFDALLESFMFNEWSADVLKNGNTQKSFTIEKTFETGATDHFFRYTGMLANTFSLNMSVQNPVTGSFGFTGKGGGVDTAIIADATYTDITATEVFNASINFGNASITGITSPKIVELSISGNNNLNPLNVMGAVDAVGISAGTFELTGSITMYFENIEAYELFLAGTKTDLVWGLTDADGNSYGFEIPKLQFGEGQVDVQNSNDPIRQVFPFTAEGDDTEGCTLKITRTPAA